MTNTADNTLNRIRALLAKAESTDSTAERDAYNAKAADLIAKYGIDEALLAAGRPDRQTPGDKIVVVDMPYARDKLDLLNSVALALRCQLVHRTRWVDGRKVHSAHLFGMAADLQRVEILYTSLLVQVAHGLAVARPVFRYSDSSAPKVAAYRRSWLSGFRSAIYYRLLEAEKTAAERAQDTQAQRYAEHGEAAAGPSVALVLADRDALVTRAKEAEYPNLKTGGRRRLTGGGFRSGYSAGQKADLGGTRIGGTGRRSLG